MVRFGKWSGVVIGVALMAGCVSTSKYKKLQSDLSSVQAKNSALQTDLTQAQASNADLVKRQEELEKSHEATSSQYENLLGQLQQEVQQGELKVTQYKNMLTVDVAEKIFFASGSATLKKRGQEVLKKVGGALSGYPDKAILVVGHTDAVPLAKAFQAVFPTNWELSVLRATNVVRFLQDEAGIAPDRLMAGGRSQYDPVAPNDTAEGRQKNRRIEISLIDKNLLSTVKEPVPAAAPGSMPAPQAVPVTAPAPTPVP